jgi:hypothetical protein
MLFFCYQTFLESKVGSIVDSVIQPASHVFVGDYTGCSKTIKSIFGSVESRANFDESTLINVRPLLYWKIGENVFHTF